METEMIRTAVGDVEMSSSLIERNEIENLCLSCRPCNTAKRTKTVSEFLVGVR